MGKTPIDETDRRLLDLLAADGAATAARLADLVALSPSAVHRRIKLLEARGLITGYRAVLSAEARGRPATVFISVTLGDQREETLRTFERAVAACREIREVHLMAGDADYLLKAEVAPEGGFERLHAEVLSRLPGVHTLVSRFSIRAVLDRAP